MIYRVDISARENGLDPVGDGLQKQLAEAGHDVGTIATRRIFLVDADASREQLDTASHKLLADPVAERAELFETAPAKAAGSLIEVHLKPGVMDPVATSAEAALRDLGIATNEVRTGRAFRFGKSVDRVALEAIARRYLANPVVEHVFFEPQLPTSFAHARIAPFEIRRVPIRTLTDDQLTKLSRDGHLFLNLVEMQAVQAHYQSLGREPTDIELETLAQTWSEHCVHKTLKSTVEVVDESGTVVRRYKNLIKETIFQSTMDLIRGTGLRHVDGENHVPEARATKADFCLSVFKDNAGVIAFDETDAVCFKVETHNRPSAIEPYGGAATGIGGCIRDVLGTGRGARPIGNTNVFCVAMPDQSRVESGEARANANAPLSTLHSPLPQGVIHPKRILQQVVAGVRDYGNRMGIPTVNGAVYFDQNYIGNPLVFAGCVGILPRDAIDKVVGRGDAIVVMGGRTGRDGIHGATFSSAELTSTHADEFSHAVQIGNAITQKKLMDVLLVARDQRLYTAVTDCGAGGLSSAIGEMGGEIGATVELEKVPLKYAGLRYDEIWISEAQERMVLSVPAEHIPTLLQLAKDEDVEATVIGTFGTDNHELVLSYNGTEVGRMSMAFMHDGIPMPTRRAVVRGTGLRHVIQEHVPEARATKDQLLALIAHPNIASKHWIIRQYDHEVQGNTVIKPLVGPTQSGPSDAAVLRPKANSMKGVVVACGMQPAVADPYAMALASIDEAIRNAICVGARLETLAILDNFCWPGVHDEVSMGTLVRACEACRDAALAYRVPFISGKDSLHNQFTDASTGKVTRIPNTLLISAIGVIDDVRQCITSDLKKAGNRLYLIGPAGGASDANATDAKTLITRRATHVLVSDLIAAGQLAACHDVSDGGWLVAAAEMAIGSGLGLSLSPETASPFTESAGSYVVEVRAEQQAAFDAAIAGGAANTAATLLGAVAATPSVQFGSIDASVTDLTRAWRGTLDW